MAESRCSDFSSTVITLITVIVLVISVISVQSGMHVKLETTPEREVRMNAEVHYQTDYSCSRFMV